VSAGGERFPKRSRELKEGGAKEERHKSDGHPKVPRNTKQKKDRARGHAGVATLERGSQSGSDYFPIIYPVAVPANGGDRGGPPGGGFPAAKVRAQKVRGADGGAGRAHD